MKSDARQIVFISTRFVTLDFEILKVITTNNAIELNNFILYKYILLLQALKKVIAKIN